MLDALMEPNQVSPLGAVRSAMLEASGKCRNAADGLIWPTEGRFFASPGQCCTRLMVPPAPSQRPRFTGEREKPVKAPSIFQKAS